MTLTQTRNSIETQSTSEPTLNQRISSLVAPLARSETYISARSKGQPHSIALERSLLDAAESAESESDKNLLTTVSLLGRFVEGSEELDAIGELQDSGKKITGTQMKHQNWLKQNAVIPFNHSIKELINTDPNLNLADVTGTLAKAYVGLYGRHNALHPEKPRTSPIKSDVVIAAIQTRINGMRHEVAAETLFSAGGIDFDYNISSSDDARGVDMRVQFDERWYGIDIKASDTGMRNAHAKNPRSHAGSTGLHAADFTGTKGTSRNSLSIPYSLAVNEAPAFIERTRRILHVTPGLGSTATTHAVSR